MEERPLVSVVVPAYNRAATIGNCLRSIQAQTHQNWEAIVVDDGSIDRTPEVVAQLAREDARIRLIRLDCNRGAQAARNAGIRAAQGDWIAFLDSDDQFLPNSLELRLAVTRKEEVRVVYSEFNVIREDGSMNPYELPPMAGWVYERLLEREGPTFQGLLVSTDALRRINYLDEHILAFQEWDTAIRLAKYYPFGFERRPTYIWDCRTPNTISKDLRRSARGYEEVFHKHYVAILRWAGPRALARHYRVAADWYRRGEDQRAARRCLMLAFLWSSLDPKALSHKLRQLLIRTKPIWPIPTLRKNTPHRIGPQFRNQLAGLLHLNEITNVRTQLQTTGHTGNVFKVGLLAQAGTPHTVIIKKVENSSDYLFYKEVLEPFNLDSPKMYGTVGTEDGLFLVMEYISHKPISWADEERFTQAVNWLIKKDSIIHDNFSRVRESSYMKSLSASPHFRYRIDQCLDIFSKGVDLNVHPVISSNTLQALRDEKECLYEVATRVSEEGRATVSHYDFQMHNILFGSEDREGRIYVIDWAEPKIDSVCMDLIGLLHCAPEAIRQKLMEMYRSQVDFENFQAIYKQSEFLVDLSEVAWMVEMLINGRRESVDVSALELQARRFQNNLANVQRRPS